MNVDDTEMGPKLKAIYSYPYWRQRIPLNENYSTPGIYGPFKYDMLHLPDDLSGKTVLEVGANDGLFSFLAERKGAEEVLATDIWSKGDPSSASSEYGWTKEGFELAHDYLGSNVQSKILSVYDIDTKSVGKKYDIVICSDVLSWLENPYRAIKNMMDVTNELLVLKDGWSGRLKDVPVIEYYGNEGIKFRANRKCIEQILMDQGAQTVKAYPLPIHLHSFSKVKIAPGTTVFKDVDFTVTLDKLQIEQEGTILYQIKNAVFVRWGGVSQQGWIDNSSNSLMEIDDKRIERNIIFNGLSFLKKNGAKAFSTELKRRIMPDSPNNQRLTIHGYI